MTTFTYGMEFEVANIEPREASQAITQAGVECVFISSGIHQHHDTWKAVYDGSVSNGAEIVSPVLTSNRLNDASIVTRILTRNGARVNTATGFHVHLGQNALEDAETGEDEDTVLARFILNYYGLHGAIGALVSNSRLTNRYCRILNRERAEAEAEWAANGNRGSRVGDRYQSLNLDSLQRHGTLEFRIHQGTLNGAKAVAWTQFLGALMTATRHGFDASAQETIPTWQIPGTADVAACGTLLDYLTGAGFLTPSASSYLKGRAGKLHA